LHSSGHYPCSTSADRARLGEGPAFLTCNTYRYCGHHVGDINRSYYRSKDEERDWRETRDPLRILADWLAGQGIAREVFDQIDAEVKAEIEAGAQFALEAAYPDPDEVDQHVYA
jgi:TPP-dependent pyruvate/acetoin dehydrogenase alpha subunit